MKFQSDYAVCVGRTIQDDYYRLDRMPMLGNKVNSVYLESRPGGGLANSSSTMAAFGTKAYLVGPIGDDALTDDLLQSVTCHGADVSYMTRDPGKKNFVHEIFLYGEERIIMLHTGQEPLKFHEEQHHYDLINNAGVVYSTVVSFKFFKDPLTMLTDAVAHGTRVFLDAEPSSIQNLEEAEKYFALASCIIFNDFAYDFYCGDEGEEKIRRLIGDSDKIILLTKAGNGAEVITKDQHISLPGYAVPVVDTTGAGDTFSAAFIHGLLTGKTPGEAAEFANKAAAYCVAHIGARSAAIDKEIIEKYIKPYAEEE